MRTSVARAVVVAALLTAALTPAVDAGIDAGASATLNGRPIPIERATTLDCHDFEYPILRCFDSLASLESDVAVQVARRNAAALFAAASVGYVAVYEHALYGGSAKILSSDVPWLSSIGWNDKISSFKSFGATGAFNEHSPSGGFIYSYGPTSRIASLSGAYNDKFSSFFID
jgi:hypothetical protein